MRHQHLGAVGIATAVLCGSSLGSVAAAQGTRTIRGTVVDTASRAVAGVNIELAGVAHAVSDDSGRFSIRVDTGLVIFDIRRLGFMPSRYGVRPGHDTTIRIMVVPSVQQLAGVDIHAKATDINGFAERMQASKTGTVRGIFVTADEIERRQVRIVDIFHGMPGVTVQRYRDTWYLTGRHLVPYPGRSFQMVACQIALYIDGIRMNDLSAESAPPANRDKIDLAALLPDPEDVAGIEYYDEPHNAPAKYQILNGACGIVLIWTKHGSETSR